MSTRFACPRCATVYYVSRGNLATKKTPYCKSCATIVRNQENATHGLERHPLYVTWMNMKRRIDKPGPKDQCYVGLDMDPAWRDMTIFHAWALAGGWKPGLSIERRELHRGYWPDNCHFIPLKHQARNRTNNSITPKLAKRIQRRVAAGEVRYRVAKEVSAATGIPLSTVVKVAYGYNW